MSTLTKSITNMEVTEMFELLESNHQVVEEIKNLITDHFKLTKESWLVTGLFDYYLISNSPRCLEILCGNTKEPHDKYLIEKLCESLRSPSTRKQGLTILGHVVRRQPSWLYKISQYGLVKELLRILKHEADIVILITGLLITTTILPLMPTYLNNHYLNEIFEVFVRLTNYINCNDKIPKEHLIHLQVALYSLFHRLYAMYPCNFLSFLRTHFGSSAERLHAFTHIVKPMLEGVKMHPCLVTSSKEKEFSTTRWRDKEFHDVIAECTMVSLDPFETGIPEYSSTNEGVSISFLNISDMQSEKEKSGFIKEALLTADMGLGSLSSFIDDISLVSAPNTPAPHMIQNSPFPGNLSLVSPSPSGIHEILPTIQSIQSPAPGMKPHFEETALEATPESTPNTTPLKESQKFKFHTHSGAAKQLVFSKPPPSTPPCTPSNSVPSSPLPRDDGPRRDSIFDSLINPSQTIRRDSLIYHRLQKVMQEQKDNELFHGGAKSESKKLPSPITIPHTIQHQNQSTSEIPTSDNSLTPDLLHHHPYQGPPPPLTPSHLSSTHDDTPEEDRFDECKNVPSSGIQMPNHREMVAFAKKVSRLRYFSQCTPSSPGTSPSSSNAFSTNETSNVNKVKRSFSCPDIIKKPNEILKVEKKEAENVPDETVKKDETNTNLNSKEEEIPAVVQPYEFLFDGIFPIKSSSNEEENYSPHLLLDKYLIKASQLHHSAPEKKFKSIEEQLIAAKLQIELLHGQLLFEKNRREIHAIRNRRLAGKCRKVQSLDEQNSTLKSQLHLLEKQIDNLKKEVIVQRNFGLEREKELNAQIHDLELKFLKSRHEIANFSEINTDLESKLLRKTEENQAINTELDLKKSDLFKLENEMKHCQKYVEINNNLKSAFEWSQKEIIILGELLRKQQETLDSYSPNRYIFEEMEDLRLSCEEEVKILKNQFDAKNSQCEAYKGLVKDLEDQLIKKGNVINEQKKLVHNTAAEYQAQLRAVEDKYESVKSINHRLELEILNLQHQVSMKALTQTRIGAVSGGRRVNPSPSNGDFRTSSSHNSTSYSDVESAIECFQDKCQLSPDGNILIFGSPQFEQLDEMTDLQKVIIESSNEGKNTQQPNEESDK